MTRCSLSAFVSQLQLRVTRCASIVEHPDNSIDIGADPQNESSVRSDALPIIQLLVRKESGTIAWRSTTSNRARKLVLAHYDSAASGDCHFPGLGQSRDISY